MLLVAGSASPGGCRPGPFTRLQALMPRAGGEALCARVGRLGSPMLGPRLLRGRVTKARGALRLEEGEAQVVELGDGPRAEGALQATPSPPWSLVGTRRSQRAAGEALFSSWPRTHLGQRCFLRPEVGASPNPRPAAGPTWQAGTGRPFGRESGRARRC